jgi:hypothetical protein
MTRLLDAARGYATRGIPSTPSTGPAPSWAGPA